MASTVIWLEDLGQGDSGLVGRKCANLGELIRADFPVPPGFALSLDAYAGFLASSGAGDEIGRYLASFEADPDDPKELPRYTEASKVLRGIVESKEMPKALRDEVTEFYKELCARTGVIDVPVAARSAGPASHPGQYESYMNATGTAHVLENIVKVWSSTFNTRSLIARARKGLALDQDPIGVAVLQMVDARAAGVMFTAEPTTADANTVVIEGSWGLGEVVVSGAVIPDNWTVDAQALKVVECRPSPTSRGAAAGSADEAGQTTCLVDDEVVEIAKIGKRIEQHFGKPQDIEWAVERGPHASIFILQARPETFRINFRF